MDLIKFVPEQLMILVAALWLIGVFLKNTKKIEDCFIPFILMVLGIGFSVAMMGITPSAILQGIVCTGVATLANNVVKQATEIVDTLSK